MPRECRKGGSTLILIYSLLFRQDRLTIIFEGRGMGDWMFLSPPPEFYTENLVIFMRSWGWEMCDQVLNLKKMLNFLFLLVRTAVIQLNLVVFYLFSIFYYYFTCQPSVKVSCPKGLYSVYFLHTKSLYSYIYVSL